MWRFKLKATKPELNFISQLLAGVEVLVGKEGENLKKKLGVPKELDQTVFVFALSVAIKLTISVEYLVQQ